MNDFIATDEESGEFEEYYKCPFCDKLTSTFGCLKRHVRTKHPLNGKCPLCGYSGLDVLIHISLKAKECDEHAVLHALYVTNRGCVNRESYKRSVKILHEKLVCRIPKRR